MSNLGSFLTGLVERNQKMKEADKVSNAMYDFLEPGEGSDGSKMGNPLGSRDEWKLMSAQDRISRTQGFVQAEALKRAIAEQQQAAQIRKLQIAQMQREQMSQDAAQNVLKSAGSGPLTLPNPLAGGGAASQFSGGQPDDIMGAAFPPLRGNAGGLPVTQESLMAAIQQNPASIHSPIIADMMSSIMSQGATAPREMAFGGRKFLVNPRGGVEAELTPAVTPKIPEGMVALGATMDENGKLDVRYGPPKAEGKALTQGEVDRISALNQAETDLNTLENIYKDLGPDYGGPLAGRVKSAVMGGQNPNVSALQNAVTAATPNLARGVFREVGVLTDADVERYKQLLPGPYDTQEVRTRKIKQLRSRIAEGRKQMVDSLKSAGRNVEGFSASGGSATGQGGDVGAEYDSEEAARAAGSKTGDIVMLYDPGTATYRKARLK